MPKCVSCSCPEEVVGYHAQDLYLQSPTCMRCMEKNPDHLIKEFRFNHILDGISKHLRHDEAVSLHNKLSQEKPAYIPALPLQATPVPVAPDPIVSTDAPSNPSVVSAVAS